MGTSFLICALLLFAPRAQETAPVTEGSLELTPLQRSLGTLSALQHSREAKQRDLKRLREAYAVATSEEERLSLFERASAVQQELDRINYDYETVATGIDVRAFDLAPADTFDLPGELQKLIQPIVEELKDATESPRQIERLRSELTHLERKERVAKDAVRSITGLLDALAEDDPLKLRPGLEASKSDWQERLEELSRNRTVAHFQLETRLAQRVSVIESTRGVLGTFFRTRGLNLLLAAGGFLAVLGAMRMLYLSAKRIFRRRGQEELPFYSRLFEVLSVLVAVLAAVAAALLVLYATGDWVLLGLALLFLVGVAWAGKTAVPLFLEQIRLLLNLGTVRERERVIVDGIPYRVSRLSFYTVLSNADLAGGVRRLPLRDLIGMRSRVSSKDEIWFPCRRHDWVLLSDGNRGQVKHQSPDSVQIELLGGSHVTYPTIDFLSLAPQNLSGGFRVSHRFGIDYKYQAISTTEVPATFTARVRAGLQAQFGEEAVRNVKVEFVEAGASSLDYALLADMGGETARDYDGIKRAIQRLCVETCNEKGWEIPFTQVTLHQAG